MTPNPDNDPRRAGRGRWFEHLLLLGLVAAIGLGVDIYRSRPGEGSLPLLTLGLVVAALLSHIASHYVHAKRPRAVLQMLALGALAFAVGQRLQLPG